MIQSSVERVAQFLRQEGHPDNVREFPEGTRTSEDAAAAIGCAVAQIAKSLVFRLGDVPVLVIASGVNRVSLDKVNVLVGGIVERADADWVREKTGFAIGGVAPVGHQVRPIVLLDQDLLKLDPVWAAAGSPSHVFQTTADWLVRLSRAQVADIRQ